MKAWPKRKPWPADAAKEGRADAAKEGRAVAKPSDWAKTMHGDVWKKIAGDHVWIAEVRLVCRDWARGMAEAVHKLPRTIARSDIAPLLAFAYLRDLRLGHPIEDEQLEVLGGLKRLTDLKINGANLDDADALRAVLGSLEHLRRLAIAGCACVEPSVLAGLPVGLVDLTLRGCHGSQLPLDLSSLRHLGRLACLRIYAFFGKKDCLRSVAGLEGNAALSTLVLTGTLGPKFSEASVGLLTGLESLTIDRAGVAKHLHALPRLTALDLSEALRCFEDADIKDVRKLVRLTSLCLPGSDVCAGPVLAAALRRLTALTSLELSTDDNEVLGAVKSMRSLRKLDAYVLQDRWWPEFQGSAVFCDLTELYIHDQGLNGDMLHWLLDNLWLAHLCAVINMRPRSEVWQRPPRHVDSLTSLDYRFYDTSSGQVLVERMRARLEALYPLAGLLSVTLPKHTERMCREEAGPVDAIESLKARGVDVKHSPW